MKAVEAGEGPVMSRQSTSVLELEGSQLAWGRNRRALHQPNMRVSARNRDLKDSDPRGSLFRDFRSAPVFSVLGVVLRKVRILPLSDLWF